MSESSSPPDQPIPAAIPAPAKHSTGPWIIAGCVLLLLILHQDNWFWNDGRLVFGFMPIGLFWHACISIGASLTWFLATKIAWPLDNTQPIQPASAPQTKSEAKS